MTLPFSTNTLIISLLCLGIFFSLSTNEFLPAHARIFPWAGKNKSGYRDKKNAPTSSPIQEEEMGAQNIMVNCLFLYK